MKCALAEVCIIEKPSRWINVLHVYVDCWQLNGCGIWRDEIHGLMCRRGWWVFKLNLIFRGLWWQVRESGRRQWKMKPPKKDRTNAFILFRGERSVIWLQWTILPVVRHEHNMSCFKSLIIKESDYSGL